jgi:hypothetical protein
MSPSEARELVELLRTSPCVTLEERKAWLEDLANSFDHGKKRALAVLATLRRERDGWDRIDEDWQALCLRRSQIAMFIHSIPNHE